MDQIIIKEKKTPHYVVFEVSGKITSYTYADFQTKVNAAVKETIVVIDMSFVSKITSHGISVLIAAHDTALEFGRRCYIMHPSELVRKALEDTGFYDLFFVIHSLAEVSMVI